MIRLAMEYNPETVMVIKFTIPVGYTTSVRESKALYDNVYGAKSVAV